MAAILSRGRWVNSQQTYLNKFPKYSVFTSWPHFYQTRSAWSVDQGSNKNHSPAYNFAPTVTKFCVMWEGLSLPHDTKFGNCRCKIVDGRSFPSWSLIHGSSWSGLIKVGPGATCLVILSTRSCWIPYNSGSKNAAFGESVQCLLKIYIDINTLRQYGQHFANDMFKCISLDEACCILTYISLKFVPKGGVKLTPSLV